MLTSSGLLIEAHRGDFNTVQLFLPVVRLRELSKAFVPQLYEELLSLRTLDKAAGLYEAISLRLSSAAEHALSELILQSLSINLIAGKLQLALKSVPQLAPETDS